MESEGDWVEEIDDVMVNQFLFILEVFKISLLTPDGKQLYMTTKSPYFAHISLGAYWAPGGLI